MSAQVALLLVQVFLCKYSCVLHHRKQLFLKRIISCPQVNSREACAIGCNTATQCSLHGMLLDEEIFELGLTLHTEISKFPQNVPLIKQVVLLYVPGISASLFSTRQVFFSISYF